MYLKILKIALFIGGIGCLTGFPWAFLPWSIVEKAVAFYGMEAIQQIPIVLYLFRVQCAWFGFFAIFFFILAHNPMRYSTWVILSVVIYFFMSIVMLILRSIYGMRALLYLIEPIFWSMIGAIILFAWMEARKRIKVWKGEGENVNQKVLRIALLICGIAAGTGFGWLLLPWGVVEKLVRLCGMEPIPEIPIAMYSFRMICSFFGLSGIYFLILSRKPMRYPSLLILGVGALFYTGLCMFILGLIYRIQLNPFLLIPIFCLIMGTAVLFFWGRHKQELKFSSHNS